MSMRRRLSRIRGLLENGENPAINPLVPAKAGTQSNERGARLAPGFPLSRE
jgi:hypothetical protein